ncbi:hypothetical protein MesoLjLb_18580 [Mesorhizobium sp. L-8-3]|nr:hypothetical protein MesoLjLb_18580 [Mesorhizobium sp. L-8-3]
MCGIAKDERGALVRSNSAGRFVADDGGQMADAGGGLAEGWRNVSMHPEPPCVAMCAVAGAIHCPAHMESKHQETVL